MHKYIALKALLFMGIFFLTSTAVAQQVTVDWRIEPGPHGGWFTEVSEDPYSERIWGVANRIVHYSDDFGEQWVAQDATVSTSRARFAFRKDGALFVGRHRSYDQGQTWEKTPLPDSLFINGPYLDVETGHLIMGTDHGFYYSNNDGDTWVKTINQRVVRFAAHEKGLALANIEEHNTYERKLVLSDDGGVSWDEVVNPTDYPVDVLIAPNEDLYVSGERASFWQLYVSSDRGVTWELVYEEDLRRNGSCAPYLWHAEAINEQGEIVYRDGITRFSIDSATCVKLSKNLPAEFDIHGEPHDEAGIHTLAIGEEERLYAYTGHNLLYRSDDAGLTWHKLSMQGVTGASTPLLFKDPSLGALLASNRHGVFIKKERQSEWEYIGFSEEQIYQIMAGPTAGSIWMIADEWIVQSTDLGLNWSPLISSKEITGEEYLEVHSITNDSERGILYAYTYYNIFYSDDGGDTWLPTNVPYKSGIDAPVLSMEITPEGHLMAYARHDIYNGLEGIWLTKDFGENWELILEEEFGFPEFFHDSEDQLWMYSGNRLYSTQDSGASWEQVQLPGHFFWIYNMVETPDRSFWLPHNCGLLRSVDRGETWTELFPEGLFSFNSFIWDEATSEAVFTTSRGNIYRAFIDTSVKVATENTVPDAVDGFALSAYPNPTSEAIHIQFTLNQNTPVIVDVYDSLGRKVSRLLDQYLPPGIHELPVPAIGLAPGVYVYRLQTPESSASGLFIRID